MFIQLLMSGLSLGSLYALIGIAFVLIFRASGVVNFAQGEFMMIGCFIGFSFITYFGLPFLLAFSLAVIILFVMGFVLEKYVVRQLQFEKVFSAVMLTIGISTMLQGLAGMIWGHEIRNMPFTSEMGVINLGDIQIAKLDLYSIITTIVVLVLLLLFINYNKLGKATMAATSDLEAAYIVGIPVHLVHGISWGLSSSVSVIAGIFIGSLVFLEPTMGFFALTAFPAIILGGLNSLLGAVVGGFMMGLIVNMAGGYLDAYIAGSVKEIIAYLALLLILMVRPYGIFGQKEIRRM